MNKLLLGSAAAALMIAPAAAGPIALTVGGYHNTMYYASFDMDALPDAAGMNIDQDAEIIFKGKGKLNNGMEVGLQVQLESAQNSDQVDEHYVYVKGGFGKVTIGSENSAARMLEAGHDKYLGYSQIEDNLLAGLKGKDANDDEKKVGYTQAVHTKLTGDAPKLTYVSPSFSGLQIGYSLTPSTDNTKGDDFGVENDTEGTSYGIRYKGKVGPAKVAVSVGGEEVDQDEDSSTRLQVSMNGIKFSYNALNRDTGSEVDYTNTAISYKVSKALTVGFDMQSDEDDTDTIYEHTRIGGSYKLGSGAKLTFSNMTAEKGDDETTYTGVGLLLKF